MLFVFLLNFKSSLFNLGNSLLTDVSFANISSKSDAGILIFMTLLFTEQKFFNFNNFGLSIISLMYHPLAVYLKSHFHSKSPWFSIYSDLFQISVFK